MEVMIPSLTSMTASPANPSPPSHAWSATQTWVPGDGGLELTVLWVRGGPGREWRSYDDPTRMQGSGLGLSPARRVLHPAF